MGMWSPALLGGQRKNGSISLGQREDWVRVTWKPWWCLVGEWGWGTDSPLE